MPVPGAPEPDPYVDAARPIALRPETYARHAEAVRRVLGANNARYPRAGRGRTTSANPGAWGSLASGATIGAGSGLALGSGTVTLCSRSGGTLTADGDTITVYNGGPAITGPKAILLRWTDGNWGTSGCT